MQSAKLAQWLRLPTRRPCVESRGREALVQLWSTRTNCVWNFPLRPLTPPAPSRSCRCPSQAQRPYSGRLSARNGATGPLQEATAPHLVSSSAQADLPCESSFSLFFLFVSILWSLWPPELCLVPSPHRPWRQPSEPGDSLHTSGPLSSPRSGLLPNPLSRTFPNSACLCKVLW